MRRLFLLLGSSILLVCSGPHGSNDGLPPTGDSGDRKATLDLPDCTVGPAVVHVPSEGVVVDVSGDWVADPKAVKAKSLRLQAGTYSLCSGPWDRPVEVPEGVGVTVRARASEGEPVVLTAGWGTVVTVRSGGTLRMADVVVTEGVGVGLWIDADAHASLTDVDVLGNTGVGIHNESGGPGDATPGLVMTRGHVVGNQGGGVHNALGARVELDGTTLEGNTSQSGGALHNLGTASLIDCAIRGNTAWSSGGGIYQDAAEIVLEGTTLSGNEARAGGGIASVNRSTVQLSDGVVRHNWSSTTCGGVLTDGVGARAELTGALVAQNTTGGSGGGLCVLNGAVAEVRNTRVVDNVAGSSGAGLYLTSDSAGAGLVRLYGSRVEGNEAGGGGGGLYQYRGVLELEDTLVAWNNARSGGGGLYLQSDGKATCTRAAATGLVGFVANSADGGSDSGGLYGSRSGEFESEGCDFGASVLENNSPYDIEWAGVTHSRDNAGSFRCQDACD